ncbi:helix-turn-helix domain-containing protein [Methylobacter sp. Wu1]|uniref:helix-turn-helix domain-containing protein n=1 Tax=Methylobacter sp. Wu1 TaxID=3119359 RepID=UPI002F9465CD
MQTLTIEEAAEFLHMSKEGLRRLAAENKVPGRKAGARWVFVKEHLADWISGRHNSHTEPIKTIRVIDGGMKKCRSTSAGKRGISSSQTQQDREYSDLLGLQTGKQRKNSTTS